jgi:hypothetical protein
MTQVLELVRFRINGSAEAFIAANAPVKDWLSTQQGFLQRHLVQDAEGGWVDAVLWANQTDAMAAGERLMAEFGASAFMGMIEPKGLTMTHAEVRLAQSR